MFAFWSEIHPIHQFQLWHSSWVQLKSFCKRCKQIAHVHFEWIIFEIIPSFQQCCKCGHSNHNKTVFPHGCNHHTYCYDQRCQSIKESVALFEMIKHFPPAPPLFVIEGIQSIQSMQWFQFGDHCGVMFSQQTDRCTHSLNWDNFLAASSIWATVLLVPYTLSFMEDRPYLSVWSTRHDTSLGPYIRDPCASKNVYIDQWNKKNTQLHSSIWWCQLMASHESFVF